MDTVVLCMILSLFFNLSEDKIAISCSIFKLSESAFILSSSSFRLSENVAASARTQSVILSSLLLMLQPPWCLYYLCQCLHPLQSFLYCPKLLLLLILHALCHLHHHTCQMCLPHIDVSKLYNRNIFSAKISKTRLNR